MDNGNKVTLDVKGVLKENGLWNYCPYWCCRFP
jgi:hypothetical protein